MTKMILVERDDKIAIVRLNRPEALNALCDALIRELGEALKALDHDETVSCLILTGSEKAFAAGADIKEMADKTFPSVLMEDFITGTWEVAANLSKPIIAAVSGYALGGGCELAMMCDLIIASDTAKFGQPEIKIGTIPGAGGSQRLTRLIGKSKAMDLCLTGRLMDAVEAERSGLVARLVPTDKLMEEALAAARIIASYSQPAVKLCKEAVNRAYETTLKEGILFERRLFHASFALEDRKEGMEAFVAKRPPRFANR